MRGMIARILLVAAFFFSHPAHALKVLIDPGHGGVDHGAVRGSLRESEIALKVALQLAELLRADGGFEISMTRDKDVGVPLDRRTQIAKERAAEVFVSIHLNSSTDKRAHGKEFYFQNQMPADEEVMFLASQENEELAAESGSPKKSDGLSSESDIRLIIDDLKRNHRIRTSGELSKILFETWMKSGHGTNTGSRAIRQAPFRVVSNIEIPSVLVELGFISNPSEGPRLATASYQAALAKSLFEGLIEYKAAVVKATNPTLHASQER